jgi:hypothetical protein
MTRSSAARQHVEWLSLIEVTGPFLSPPVLLEALPQGLGAVSPDLRARVRIALAEWQADSGLMRAWVRFVLRDVLEFPDAALCEGPAIPPTLVVDVPEHNESLRPDLVLMDRDRPRMLVAEWPAAQELGQRVSRSRWVATPRDRMAELLRGVGCRMGLVTNGIDWTLVVAKAGAATTYANWDAGLWAEGEPLALASFRTLLSTHRLLGVAERDTLEGLLDRSAGAQEEVTNQLGRQVREAVEMLVSALDRSDREAGGTLLKGVGEMTLYRAAVAVMMRLVFLFSAEERRLLPLGDPLYDASYAASTLRAQLQEDADRHGEDPLERRSAAWHRLLATFRVIHSGIQHEQLRLPAHGGGLFDPQTYPFLEGRIGGDGWQGASSRPLPVDDRTVLHLLDALQTLRQPGVEARRLSFAGLDVEQIGHVYEGLLDHLAIRATAPAVALDGRKEPEIALSLIEERAALGRDGLIVWLAEETGRSAAAIARGLDQEPAEEAMTRLLTACDNDADLTARIEPYLALVRSDHRGLPRVFQEESVYVTRGPERRVSGTYYTPRALAEEVVTHALDPLVYEPGPADGVEPGEWRLRPAADLLDLRICDPAMGSGAFLVAACRYLGSRVVEAWEAEGSASEDEGLSEDPDDRVNQARRLVAERCLYGVDFNPMAVDMAKLSLWLVTLARGRPFTFLDHALRPGDSLLGITDPAQLETFHLDPERGRQIQKKLEPFRWNVSGEESLRRATALRRRLESFSVRELRDAELKERLRRESEAELETLRTMGDVVIGAALSSATKGGDDQFETRLLSLRSDAQTALNPDASSDDRMLALDKLKVQAIYWLDEGRPQGTRVPSRKPFHWVLEFPEVFLDDNHPGFAAVVGNPPFIAGTSISGGLGSDYRQYLVDRVSGIGSGGRGDLVAYFFLRAAGLTRTMGSISLLATNTIAQGDTREIGLDQLLARDWSIYRAVKSQPWPGSAALEVSQIWLRQGPWRGRTSLDGASGGPITSSLERRGRVFGRPNRLAANSAVSFEGSHIFGMGFTVSPPQAAALLEADARNSEVLQPFLNGEDLQRSPDHSATRWVINFGERSEIEARSYPECWGIVERAVKPSRLEKSGAGYARMVEKWWQFWRPRAELYRSIASLRRVLALTITSKTVMPVFVANGSVYSHALQIFAYDDDAHFGLLSSAFHQCWALAHASTLETRIRYTPSDCWETFPQPTLGEHVAVAGAALDVHRGDLMLQRWEGLTKTYNRVHDSKEAADDIRNLRVMHVELDHVVAAAYGWSELDLDHGFHDTRQGVRYTIGPMARTEVLDRLLELNHERYSDEVRRGLHDRPSARLDAGQMTLETV